MTIKEKKYLRSKRSFQIFSLLMLLSFLAIVSGIMMLIFAKPHFGVTLLTYGLVLLFLLSSFFFISRTRYLKAKLAYQAEQMVQAHTNRPQP